MTTALGFVPADEHMEAGHPESPGRLRAIIDLLALNTGSAGSSTMAPVAAEYEHLAQVHEQSLISLVRETSMRGAGHLDADTYVTAASYKQAKLAKN